jgi:hypothetical protein
VAIRAAGSAIDASVAHPVASRGSHQRPVDEPAADRRGQVHRGGGVEPLVTGGTAPPAVMVPTAAKDTPCTGGSCEPTHAERLEQGAEAGDEERGGDQERLVGRGEPGRARDDDRGRDDPGVHGEDVLQAEEERGADADLLVLRPWGGGRPGRVGSRGGASDRSSVSRVEPVGSGAIRRSP